ncbi:hypothetical protein FBUS_05783 [Fasciolopsis buskii]|uniref:Uncharacterized protein n=1 Tax=Fasciolopsis buskii TaxID=27845 RepID=A0A8E0VK62_9TREM|nr:hypothetical protein FBUS_05783 [Fasciolopsis buski]
MTKTNKRPRGCWAPWIRKKRMDKQTSTTLDIRPRKAESSILSPLSLETSKIVLRGTFSLENLHHQPSPPTKVQLDYSCSANPLVSMSSNRMSQPMNVREHIEAPYVSSTDSSLHTDDLAGLPNCKDTAQPYFKRVSPLSPQPIDGSSNSRVLGDDNSVDPYRWSHVPTQPSLTQTRRSESVMGTSASIPKGPSPEMQFCPTHKQCLFAVCPALHNRHVNCISTVPIANSGYNPDGVPLTSPTAVVDSSPASVSHKVFVIPQTHTDFYPVCLHEPVRPTSAGGYLVDCGISSVPVQLPTDSTFSGIRQPHCRCHSVNEIRFQWLREFGRDPDYMTMNISPPPRNPDTNQNHTANK